LYSLRAELNKKNASDEAELGLFGRQEHIDLPERAHRALNSLSEMRAFDAQEHDAAKG
jgi:hypothetical protein